MHNMENAIVSDAYNVSPAYTENVANVDVKGNYETAKDILQTYIVPVIIITGFIGNTICFIVFVASPLKRISTSVYLAGLAFSDTGFLVCLGIGWLESLSIRFFHKYGICQITVYASFVFSFTSIWFVNAFTIEMYVAVFHPEKGTKLCTPKNARRIVGALSAAAALMYIYAFWIAKVVAYPGSGIEVCLILPEDAKMAMILSVLDTVLTLVVPFTMILVMITRLFVHISKFYRSELESPGNSTVGENNHSETQQGANGSGNTNPTMRQATEAHDKLTRMLVVTVIVFLVLNLPSHAIKVQFLFRSLLSPNVLFTDTEGFIQIVFQVLYYANFSVNFLLYSACGKSFRAAMLRISLNVRYGYCRKIFDCPNKMNRLTKNGKKLRNSSENQHDIVNEQQHSRLVDIHLNEIRFSQLPSIGSEFVCQSPPCLLAFESEQLLEEAEH